VNLACGRNPWKKACNSDATFRAFKKDPNFLSSILPISNELEEILNSVFQVQPEKRIGLQELRHSILRCPRFASTPRMAMPPTPPPDQVYFAVPKACLQPALEPISPVTPVFAPIQQHYTAPPSPPASDDDYDSEGRNSVSSQSSYESLISAALRIPAPPTNKMRLVSGGLMPQAVPFVPQVQMVGA